MANGEAGATRPAFRRTALRVTLTFAVALLLIGVVGAGSLAVLLRAIRPATAADLAQLVCTAYQNQNYDLLTQQIDTSQGASPSSTATPSDSSANQQLADQLRGLDTTQGAVTACVYKGLPQYGASEQYAFEMQRAKLRGGVGLLMTFLHEPDGSWRIARDSDFFGATA